MKKTLKKPGRPAKSSVLLVRLKKIGIFKANDAKPMGISKSTLQRMVLAGEIDSLRSGYFVHPKSTRINGNPDFDETFDELLRQLLPVWAGE